MQEGKSPFGLNNLNRSTSDCAAIISILSSLRNFAVNRRLRSVSLHNNRATHDRVGVEETKLSMTTCMCEEAEMTLRHGISYSRVRARARVS